MPHRPAATLLLALCLAAGAADAAAEPPVYAAPYARVLAPPADGAAYHARLQQARAALLAKRWPQAEQQFQQLVDAYPLERETWVGLGTALREQGKAEASIAAYRESIALIGGVPGSARYWIAVQQAKRGQAQAALETLAAMLAEDHELDRPGLLGDPAFEALQREPRWQALLAPAAKADETRVAGWNRDLDWLLAEARRLAPAYRAAGLPAATRQAAAALRADLPKLSDAQAYARLAQLLATLNLGHTMLWGAGPDGAPPGARLAFTFLPVLLHAFPEGLYVVHADAAHQALRGRRLVAIDGVDARTVFDQVASATSVASPTEALWTVPMRISDSLLLHGLGVTRSAARATLTLVDDKGRREDVELEAGRWMPRSKLPPPPQAEAPLFLRRVQESHWLEHWPKLATTYVQFNQVAPDPDEDLPAFGLRLRQQLAESGARHVIVDLRHNNGGNSFTYVELLRTLVAFSAQDGHDVYALIGRNVYSAAANFSTDLERLVKPVFVGEPTAMTGNQDGDEGRILLPYSGIAATVSGLRWQLSHPWDGRTSIAPQLPVALGAADWLAGRDPVLAATRAMIERSEAAR